jgi:hypothetical protein
VSASTPGVMFEGLYIIGSSVSESRRRRRATFARMTL